MQGIEDEKCVDRRRTMGARGLGSLTAVIWKIPFRLGYRSPFAVRAAMTPSWHDRRGRLCVRSLGRSCREDGRSASEETVSMDPS